MINPSELPIIHEVRNNTHISTIKVRLYLHKKTKRETSDAL